MQCGIPGPYRGLVSVGTHVPGPENQSHLLFIDDHGFYVEKVMNDDRVRLRNFVIS